MWHLQIEPSEVSTTVNTIYFAWEHVCLWGLYGLFSTFSAPLVLILCYSFTCEFGHKPKPQTNPFVGTCILSPESKKCDCLKRFISSQHEEHSTHTFHSSHFPVFIVSKLYSICLVCSWLLLLPMTTVQEGHTTIMVLIRSNLHLIWVLQYDSAPSDKPFITR